MLLSLYICLLVYLIVSVTKVGQIPIDIIIINARYTRKQPLENISNLFSSWKTDKTK